MADTPERWRPVKGYEGRLEVSDHGRVRRLRKREGPRLLVLTERGRGYLGVHVSLNGVSRQLSLHRMVAEAFIPNPEGHPVVRHRNHDPSDCRVENLAWGTHADNVADSTRDGRRRYVKGEQNGLSKLTEDDVRAIRADGRLQRVIAAEYGTTQGNVSMLKAGKSWAHLKAR